MDRALCNRSDNLNDLDYLRTCENHLENALCIFEENKQPNAMHISAQLTGIDPAICLTMPQAPLCMSYMRGIFERPNRAIVFLQYELVEKKFCSTTPEASLPTVHM